MPLGHTVTYIAWRSPSNGLAVRPELAAENEIQSCVTCLTEPTPYERANMKLLHIYTLVDHVFEFPSSLSEADASSYVASFHFRVHVESQHRPLEKS